MNVGSLITVILICNTHQLPRCIGALLHPLLLQSGRLAMQKAARPSWPKAALLEWPAPWHSPLQPQQQQAFNT
jgi:hypothetical protein